MFRLPTRVDSRPRPAVGGKGDFTRARLDLTTDGQLTVTRPPRDLDHGFVSGAQIDLYPHGYFPDPGLRVLYRGRRSQAWRRRRECPTALSKTWSAPHALCFSNNHVSCHRMETPRATCICGFHRSLLDAGKSRETVASSAQANAWGAQANVWGWLRRERC